MENKWGERKIKVKYKGEANTKWKHFLLLCHVSHMSECLGLGLPLWTLWNYWLVRKSVVAAVMIQVASAVEDADQSLSNIKGMKLPAPMWTHTRAPSDPHHNAQTPTHTNTVYIPQRAYQAARSCFHWLKGWTEASWGGWCCHQCRRGQSSAADPEHVHRPYSCVPHCLYDTNTNTDLSLRCCWFIHCKNAKWIFWVII